MFIWLQLYTCIRVTLAVYIGMSLFEDKFGSLLITHTQCLKLEDKLYFIFKNRIYVYKEYKD